ncbi:MAG: hypothetical protein EZS28_044016, partial [Streblomastix strix]
NEAMNYKLGSMDWGRNSISKDLYSQKKMEMRYQEHNVPSYIQLNAPLAKAEKANKSKTFNPKIKGQHDQLLNTIALFLGANAIISVPSLSIVNPTQYAESVSPSMK